MNQQIQNRSCSSNNYKPNLLEIPAIVTCNGGPYTWNEKQMMICPQYTEQQHNQFSCSGVGPSPRVGGMIPASAYKPGIPIHFEYTPMSNSRWNNERCL